MAQFLNELHQINVPNGPLSRRGVPLINLDIETKNALSQLKEDINTSIYANLWNELSNLPYWSQPLVWMHGDLLPGNILIKNNNRLSAMGIRKITRIF